jgi:hypothetical protein
MVPVTFRTQVTAEYDADGAGRHLANLRQRSGVSDTAERAVLGGEALGVAIGHARAALAALLYWLPAGDPAWPEVHPEAGLIKSGLIRRDGTPGHPPCPMNKLGQGARSPPCRQDLWPLPSAASCGAAATWLESGVDGPPGKAEWRRA